MLKILKSFFSSFILLCLFSTTTLLADEKVQSVISLSGTGNVSTAPDMAILSFGVVREAKSARKALDANNQAVGNILNAMKQNGIDDKDLQTSGFNIQPQYFYPKRKVNGEQPSPKITGYTVSNTLTVRVRDIDKTGSILDLSVTLGMNSGGNIKFTNADTTPLLREARENAVKDAIEKAETLAAAANVKLGTILKITESTQRSRPIGIAQARSLNEAQATSVPIASGENTYRVTVQMSWEIAQ